MFYAEPTAFLADAAADERECRRRRRSSPALDQPLVLLVASHDLVNLLRAEGGPFYFGEEIDPATGIERQLLDAVNQAAHPTDLVRRLGQWADCVQRAVPHGMLATCWHPAVSPEVMRQASRYPVHVVNLHTPDDARTLANSLHTGGPAATEVTSLPA